MIEIMKQHQSAEIEDIADWFKDALAALTLKRDAEIDAAMGELTAQQDQIARESATVNETLAEMRDRLPAVRRVALADADKLLAQGQREEAEGKKQEAHDATVALAAMERRTNELEARWSEIENTRSEVAAEIRREWAENDVMPVLRAAERAYFIEFLDRLEEGGTDDVYTLFEKTDHPLRKEVEAVAQHWYAGERGVTRTFWYNGRR